jgi:hypothetical protein
VVAAAGRPMTRYSLYRVWILLLLALAVLHQPLGPTMATPAVSRISGVPRPYAHQVVVLASTLPVLAGLVVSVHTASSFPLVVQVALAQPTTRRLAVVVVVVHLPVFLGMAQTAPRITVALVAREVREVFIQRVLAAMAARPAMVLVVSYTVAVAAAHRIREPDLAGPVLLVSSLSSGMTRRRPPRT